MSQENRGTGVTQNEHEEETACLTHPMTTQGQQGRAGRDKLSREVGGSELWKGPVSELWAPC